MTPNFYHQVSFTRRQFSLASLFFLARLFFGTFFSARLFLGARLFFWARLFVFSTIFFGKVLEKVVPEKTDVVKKKLDDKN